MFRMGIEILILSFNYFELSALAHTLIALAHTLIALVHTLIALAHTLIALAHTLKGQCRYFDQGVQR